MNFNDLGTQQSIIQQDLLVAIQKVLAHGNYIMGPEVQELETTLSNYTEAKHCISCGNGTDALMLALMALNIQPGDEVITSPFTFMATSEVAAILQAIPVFVDIDPQTYTIDPSLIEEAITERTKAIIVVSLYGLIPDMDSINEIAERHGITVIEDAAQSFGATYKGRRSCNVSAIGTTSFFPSKPLGCYGDGGAVFTNDDEIARKIREFRVHGQSKRYYQTSIGVNSRLDTLQAAILLEKMRLFPEETTLRQSVGRQYNQELESYVKIPFIPGNQTHVFGQYTIRSQHRDDLQAYLKEKGIPTAVYYPVLLNEQPAMTDRCKVVGNLSHSMLAVEEVLSLPMHPYLSEQDQQRVIEAIIDFSSVKVK